MTLIDVVIFMAGYGTTIKHLFLVGFAGCVLGFITQQHHHIHYTYWIWIFLVLFLITPTSDIWWRVLDYL